MGNEKGNQGYYMVNRRIGSTIYRVKVYGSETATETMEDKILRLIQNEASARQWLYYLGNKSHRVLYVNKIPAWILIK